MAATRSNTTMGLVPVLNRQAQALDATNPFIAELLLLAKNTGQQATEVLRTCGRIACPGKCKHQLALTQA